MNVPERLRAVAKHLRLNCKSCCHAQGSAVLAETARKVSVADMEDDALDLDRIALRLDELGIHEIQ